MDSAVFLGAHVAPTYDVATYLLREWSQEFVPGSHQYLLTVLSIWWAFGQLIGSLVSNNVFRTHVSRLSFWVLDCLASHREFLLPNYDHSNCVPTLRKSRMALFPIHDGRAHVLTLDLTLLCIHPLREPEVPHGPRPRC